MTLRSVKPLDTNKPSSAAEKAHHVGGNPPTSFANPWPSFKPNSFTSMLNTRFTRDRPDFVPVPPRDELVPVRKPDWGADRLGLKATWIGHASWLIETTAAPGASRGVRILLDPVFAERTSPFSFIGPKRYTPTPCALEELPEVDAVVISHNHYDHLDLETVKQLYARSKRTIHFFCPLGIKPWFCSSGFNAEHVTELDWWDGVVLDVTSVGSVNIICTPAQHFSGRGILDHGKALWASWVIEENVERPCKLYFAGDTGYRYFPLGTALEDEKKLPHCPAFREIGDLYGPFDLALLPIGLYSPRNFMSSVHCAPEESACIHKDVRSKKSIGMHWGTVRGGLSGQYEDVREPPRRWKEVCEREGLKWGEEVGLCDVGETVFVLGTDMKV